MKYAININQYALMKLKSDLDITDCSMLEYIIDLCTSQNRKVSLARVDGFTLLDYKELIRQMPLLKIKSKSAISLRIKKIKDERFIKTLMSKNGNIFVKLTEKIDKLKITCPTKVSNKNNNNLNIADFKL